jgi:hypothetical protein
MGLPGEHGAVQLEGGVVLLLLPVLSSPPQATATRHPTNAKTRSGRARTPSSYPNQAVPMPALDARAAWAAARRAMGTRKGLQLT